MNIATQLKRLGATPEMIARALCNGKPIVDMLVSSGVASARIERDGVLRIVVPGPAPGKPRMTRRDVWKKRPAVVRYRDWCDLVRSIAGDVPPAEKVAELRIVAYYEPPKSWGKRKRALDIGTQHHSKPDADNVAKAVLDCLWPDNDSAIADFWVRKRWDWNARLEIEIVLNGGTDAD